MIYVLIFAAAMLVLTFGASWMINRPRKDWPKISSCTGFERQSDGSLKPIDERIIE